MQQLVSEIRRKNFYRFAGISALIGVLIGIGEILITFLPDGMAVTETVFDWFDLLNRNPFMGLRNLGLINIAITLLGTPVYLALYAAHKHKDRLFAGFATVLSFVGLAVFLSTNRAFPMLALSREYATATIPAQRDLVAAAGQALLAVGASHTNGTFLAFFLSELAGILISVVMLRGEIFPKSAAYAGILAFSLLMTYDLLASFFTSSGFVLLIAVVGGLLTLAWNTLLARRFFQLSRSENNPGR